MPKRHFNKVAKQWVHGCSAVNMLRIFRTLFLGTPLGGCFSFLLLLEDLSKTYFPFLKRLMLKSPMR